MITNYSEISEYLNLCQKACKEIQNTAVNQLAKNPHHLIVASCDEKRLDDISCKNALYPYIISLGYALSSKSVLDETQELLDMIKADVNTDFEHTERELSEVHAVMQHTLEAVSGDCSQLYSENYYTLLQLDELRCVTDRKEKARARAIKKMHEILGSEYLEKIKKHRQVLRIVTQNWSRL